MTASDPIFGALIGVNWLKRGFGGRFSRYLASKAFFLCASGVREGMNGKSENFHNALGYFVKPASFFLDPDWIRFIALVLCAGQKWLVERYYLATLEHGYYPPEADSIAIGIIGELMLKIIALPFFVGYLIWCLWKARGKDVTWQAWDRNRPWRSSLVTLLHAGFVALIVLQLIEDVQLSLLINSLADAAWIYFWLALRATAVAPMALVSVRKAENSASSSSAPSL